MRTVAKITRHRGLLFILVLLAFSVLALHERPLRSSPPPLRVNPSGNSGTAPGAVKPILIVTTTANPFSAYYAEILRNEGITYFTTCDKGSLSGRMLSFYDLIIVGEMALTEGEVNLIKDYLHSGGKVIAMRPDKKLASLCGLIDAGSTLSNGYLLIDTSTGPGAGLVDETLQFHATADLYRSGGATTVATLYSTATTPKFCPAVAMNQVGNNGGEAAAFTYDLARSVVYTRQGNPAWSGQERDGFPPIRSDDLFYGASASDPHSDWVDSHKLQIPQADEQQRLLANIILRMNEKKRPFPRFWYLPRGLAAAIIMTGDDHGVGGTAGRFNSFISKSPLGCSVQDWECIRGTSYIFLKTPLTNEEASAYNEEGFEIALHPNTNCSDWTPSSLDSFFTDQITRWMVKYKSLPAPVSNRTHCIAWSDYASQPHIEESHGIRLDTSYYYWPASWVANRPGFFTGSGMPMRFATSEGKTLDVYQAATQMTDESAQRYPYTIDTLLDNALGPKGFYGVFTVNAHTDQVESSVADAVISSAQSRGIPIVSARQMLQWLDGRNTSTITAISFRGDTLRLSVRASPQANGLMTMVPIAAGRSITRVIQNGVPTAFDLQTIKGIRYARFLSGSGTYEIAFTPETTKNGSPHLRKIGQR